SESGIGAGTRRIEAVTSEGAFELMNNEIMQFYKVAELLKAKPKDTVHRTEVVLQELKELQRENESLAAKLANIEAGSILDRVIEVDGVKLLSQKVQVQDMNTLRNMADDLKKKNRFRNHRIRCCSRRKSKYYFNNNRGLNQKRISCREIGERSSYS